MTTLVVLDNAGDVYFHVVHYLNQLHHNAPVTVSLVPTNLTICMDRLFRRSVLDLLEDFACGFFEDGASLSHLALRNIERRDESDRLIYGRRQDKQSLVDAALRNFAGDTWYQKNTLSIMKAHIEISSAYLQLHPLYCQIPIYS